MTNPLANRGYTHEANPITDFVRHDRKKDITIILARFQGWAWSYTVWQEDRCIAGAKHIDWSLDEAADAAEQAAGL